MPVVRKNWISVRVQGLLAFNHIIAWLTPPWTSTLEAVKIRLRNRDVLEDSIAMRNVLVVLRHIRQRVTMRLSLIIDAVCHLGFCLRSRPALATKNLFLRQPLAWYQERYEHDRS